MNSKVQTPIPASERVDWSDLRLFLSVAENGSIASAARNLGLSQPTVSSRLRNLESRLNAQLVTRGLNGIALTEAGEQVRRHALAMQRSAIAIDRMVRRQDNRLEGRVRLFLPDGIGSFWIGPNVASFQRINPGITLSLHSAFFSDGYTDEADITVTYSSQSSPLRTVEPIATVHYAPFAARRYLDLYGLPKSLQDIVSHRTVHHSGLQLQKENWSVEAEASRTLSAFNLETNCSATVLFSVLSGAGVAFLPTGCSALCPDLVMLSDGPIASPVLYITYSPETRTIARFERVFEWLARIFDPVRNPWFDANFVHPRSFGAAASAGHLLYTPPASATSLVE